MDVSDEQQLEALREVLDAARALAATRLAELTDPGAEIEPFALVRTPDGLRVVLLGDVAEHLESAAGMSRVAGTLLERYDADAFAIAARWWASPTGEPDHPQRREVLRVFAGHAGGSHGAVFAAVERGPDGPRLAPVWETSD